ncbi:MAG: hypothetical protein EAX86_09835 [Candidatus Heimdallarchaeota archaeon]|nr:hypothetical protein [Candidatus Heimdallarchaeota archaeon]
MLELNIITKNGILVFSHPFSGVNLQEEDRDMRAGLLTAVLNVLRETQGESISSIKHKDYHLVLYEGVLTYGILTTTKDDPTLHGFIRKIVLRFELMYTYELHKGIIFNRKDFEDFREVVTKEYSALLNIDISKVGKILEIMQRSSISDYIIYEDKFFNPVFMSVVDPVISSYANQLTQIFRGIVEFGSKINQEHILSDISFEEIHLHAIVAASHSVVVILPENQSKKDIVKKELVRIQKNIMEVCQT